MTDGNIKVYCNTTAQKTIASITALYYNIKAHAVKAESWHLNGYKTLIRAKDNEQGTLGKAIT